MTAAEMLHGWWAALTWFQTGCLVTAALCLVVAVWALGFVAGWANAIGAAEEEAPGWDEYAPNVRRPVPVPVTPNEELCQDLFCVVCVKRPTA